MTRLPLDADRVVRRRAQRLAQLVPVAERRAKAEPLDVEAPRLGHTDRDLLTVPMNDDVGMEQRAGGVEIARLVGILRGTDETLGRTGLAKPDQLARSGEGHRSIDRIDVDTDHAYGPSPFDAHRRVVEESIMVDKLRTC